MIKMIFCLRRLPHLSREQFQQYWLEQHAPLVREVAPLLRIRRYVQSHSFEDPRISASIEARKGQVEMFDGVAELWWDSVDDIIAVGNTREGRAAGRRLLADEANFIDIPASPLFYSREHVIVS